MDECWKAFLQNKKAVTIAVNTLHRDCTNKACLYSLENRSSNQRVKNKINIYKIYIYIYIYFVWMFDGFEECKTWRIANERRFTKTVFNIPCSDAGAKLSRVNTNGQHCQTRRLAIHTNSKQCCQSSHHTVIISQFLAAFLSMLQS